VPTIDETARDIETKLLAGLFPGERVLAVGRCADIPELANIDAAGSALRSELERRGIGP